MTASKKMVSLEEELTAIGHTISLPAFTHKYARLDSQTEMHTESAQNKIQHGLIKKYFDIIQKGDSILVVNESRKDIENYVGANTLIEMAFAHVLNKPIYMLNPIPQMNYSDEIIAMEPVVLNRDLTKIK